MVRKSIAIALMGLMLSSCASNRGEKETAGTILGGIGGAVIGSQFGGGTGQLVGVAAGTLLGAFIGSEIGASLDKADRMYAEKSANHAFEYMPTGQTAVWQNPDSHNSGTFTPVKTYQSNAGQYCREYQQTITVGGRTERAYGTACRQTDGSWKITSA